jgi:DNA-binding MarR family transcriptional regulator
MRAEQMGLRYLSLAHRLRKVVDGHMTVGGLSLSRTKVLRVLADQGPVHQATLAGALGMAPRSVTQAVEALARDGLVDRQPDPADGRAKLVALTDAGATALAAGTTAGDQVLRKVFGDLDACQLTGLDRILDVLEASTEQAGA